MIDHSRKAGDVCLRAGGILRPTPSPACLTVRDAKDPALHFTFNFF